MQIGATNFAAYSAMALPHGKEASARPSATEQKAGAEHTGAEHKAADKVRSAQEALKDPSSEASKALQELKQRDREVRQHEQAHIAAGGRYVRGAASYSYQKGPDGRNYAVGGEVQIDTAAVPNDPQATLLKMQTVQRAAMAPAEPSAQDRAVAAQAAQTAAQARADMQKQITDRQENPYSAEDAGQLRQTGTIFDGMA